VYNSLGSSGKNVVFATFLGAATVTSGATGGSGPPGDPQAPRIINLVQ
jgi:hypothetical protein